MTDAELLAHDKIGLEVAEDAGGEATIAAMDEHSRWNIGRRTYSFVRQCMKDPVLRARIQERAAELRAEAEAAAGA